MSNKMKLSHANKAAICEDNLNVGQNDNNLSLDEKYYNQFVLLALETCRGVINAVRENAGDYKAISEDKNASSIDKALGKRKILAADIGLGTLGTGSALGMVWLVKKVFAA